ncbi:MAG: hypothetical protein DMG04_05020 [Acidobacteria bacterium]|nr:MAG: hypothetical protein DMG04_05020 [Acidobacteriota bacterium]PYQ84510.1 MAG: hypothetical protein DMG03_10855 [Acidobacteriota bacterium]PYQ89971.1 MAG: hypothetical protein DMG02_11770 [Acidobacteriota bacterium]PYR08918.1 MAG: hypothetical protein DMF99_17110 [Acidobacteriota bacterium]
MSSATSTKSAEDSGLQTWQFFLLAALGCATAVTFLARGQGIVSIILLGILMITTAAVGIAVLRMVRPLVSSEEDRTVMIGHRTRAALEREKHLTLRAIKELEFDRAMGKLAEADFQEMSTRLRMRAAGLLRQLDAGSGYRDQIERDLAARLKGSRYDSGSAGSHNEMQTDTGSARLSAERIAGEREASAERLCANCSTVNDADATFCKSCGVKL